MSSPSRVMRLRVSVRVWTSRLPDPVTLEGALFAQGVCQPHVSGQPQGVGFEGSPTFRGSFFFKQSE